MKSTINDMCVAILKCNSATAATKAQARYLMSRNAGGGFLGDIWSSLWTP